MRYSIEQADKRLNDMCRALDKELALAVASMRDEFERNHFCVVLFDGHEPVARQIFSVFFEGRREPLGNTEICAARCAYEDIVRCAVEQNTEPPPERVLPPMSTRLVCFTLGFMIVRPVATNMAPIASA